jgi:hypothetical protein
VEGEIEEVEEMELEGGCRAEGEGFAYSLNGAGSGVPGAALYPGVRRKDLGVAGKFPVKLLPHFNTTVA